jgi:hypothetical protein
MRNIQYHDPSATTYGVPTTGCTDTKNSTRGEFESDKRVATIGSKHEELTKRRGLKGMKRKVRSETWISFIIAPSKSNGNETYCTAPPHKPAR